LGGGCGTAITNLLPFPPIHAAADQKAEFKIAFDQFDTDGSGDIDTSELKLVMEQVGQHPSPEEVKELVAEYDTDGNGELSFEEFLEMMAKWTMGPSKTEMLNEMFNVRQERSCVSFLLLL
jgi:Ca2+-binding EF-hand superfamily protein